MSVNMPLTAKEKMKRYRAKLLENPIKRKSALRKDRERKRKTKTLLTPKQQRRERQKNKQRVQQCRKRQKDAGETQPLDKMHTTLHSPQSIGKAKHRVKKYLPKSPRKRKAVVAALASDFGWQVPSLAKKGNNSTNPETEKKVREFFLNTSWVCPGKRDVVIIRQPGQEKQTLQKHYMLTTVKEAHSIYEEENPDNHISYSKFAKLRPQEVKLLQDIPHTSCLCKYHENVRLLLQALHSTEYPIPTGFRDFIALIVCDQKEENCMAGKCTQCPGIDSLRPSQEMMEMDLQWFQWAMQDGKVAKTMVQGTFGECFQELKKQTPYFLKHTFVKRVQAKAFEEEKKSVLDDKDKVVIELDFAENYTTVTQNEIQSAYWSYGQVTLFTVCAWEKYGTHSMVITSDYMSHDKYAVNTFFRKVLHHLETEVRPFTDIEVFTDGPATQFKQRFLLASTTLLNKNISWNFFATSHGKGCVDGIGGRMKRDVAIHVKSGKAEVSTSEEFAKVASKLSQKTPAIHCPKKEVEKVIPQFDADCEGVEAIPNTKQMHKVTVVSRYVVDVKPHAQSSTTVRHIFKLEHPQNDQEKVSNEKTDLNRAVEVVNVVLPDAAVGKWVLIPYHTAKTTNYYVGQILTQTESQEKVAVKFLQHKGQFKFVWPEREDVDVIETTNITLILPEPQMDRRDVLSFQKDLSSYNIQ